MSREMPVDSDSSVVLVTQGWDYYFDDAKQYHFLATSFTMENRWRVAPARLDSWPLLKMDGR